MQIKGSNHIIQALHIGCSTYYNYRKKFPEFEACFVPNKHICLDINKANQIIKQIRTKQDVINYHGHTFNTNDLITFLNTPIPIDWEKKTYEIKSLWWKCKQYQINNQEMHPIEKLKLWSEQTKEREDIDYNDIIKVFMNCNIYDDVPNIPNNILKKSGN